MLFGGNAFGRKRPTKPPPQITGNQFVLCDENKLCVASPRGYFRKNGVLVWQVLENILATEIDNGVISDAKVSTSLAEKHAGDDGFLVAHPYSRKQDELLGIMILCIFWLSQFA